MIRLAILASGSGSNAQCIINHFQNHPTISIQLIGSNRSKAYVLERAKESNIPFFIFSQQELNEGKVLETLIQQQINYIVLAGFLALIPAQLVKQFENRILNIHPSLLPKFGGKGMYGLHVHQAVKQAAEKWSGPTIHLVNENFDEGKILFQARVKIHDEDRAEKIQQKVLHLEHRHFAHVVESYILTQP